VSVRLGPSTRPRDAAAAPEAAPRARPWRAAVAGCLALAALSLLGPWEPTYDPWAWLLWGRQITGGDLDTTGGPSWKPLTVLLTTVFSLFGDDAAPRLWLLVARAGGLLALVFAFRVAARVGGPAAGVVAAGGLLLVDGFASNVMRGNSEGLLVALTLWAVERHADGRRRDAFLLGVAAGLLRPEVWIFVAPYGLWLVRGAWAGPARARTVALVALAGVALPVLWFVPEWVASGSPLRGASRAREPVPGSPGEADFPFLEVFRNASDAVPYPVAVLGVVAVAAALIARPRDARGRLVLALAAIATVLMLEVALLAQAGTTGNVRYVTLPAALVCVLGGIGAVELVRTLRGALRPRARWAALAGVVAVSAPLLVANAERLDRQLDRAAAEGRLAAELPDVLERAGGRDAVASCRPLFTDPFLTQLVAYRLHVRGIEVGIHPDPPGTTIAPRGVEADDARFPVRATTGRWTVRATCPRR
jgi:hypothetical protein